MGGRNKTGDLRNAGVQSLAQVSVNPGSLQVRTPSREVGTRWAWTSTEAGGLMPWYSQVRAGQPFLQRQRQPLCTDLGGYRGGSDTPGVGKTWGWWG